MVTSFTSIFSHSVDCLFILFMLSFAVKTHVSVIRSYLFIFAFVSFTLGVGSKIIQLQFMSESLLPIFSSRSLTVSSLKIFKIKT